MEKKKFFTDWSTKKKIIYGCITVWLLIGLITVLTETPPTPEEVAKQQAQTEIREKERAEKDRQKKIEKLFHSSLNFGYNYALNNEIKETLHDPGSFKHIETVYWDKGDYLLVQVTFRAKNRFGALVRQKVQATMDLDGIILGKAMMQ